MGLEELTREIEEKTKKEIQQIEEQTKKAIKEIELQSKQEIQKKRKALLEQVQHELHQLSKVKEAEAHAKATNSVLEKKAHILKHVISEAKKTLIAQSKKKGYILNLLHMAQQELDVAKVYCRKEDCSSIDGISAQSMPISGGMIAENNDGTISVDYTYDSILHELQEKHMSELAKVLFV